MIEESARVARIEGESAWLETRRQSACGACSVNKGCGSAVLAKVLGKRRAMIKARSLPGIAVGDEVVIGIREGALVRGSFAVYAVPLAGLLAGAGLGRYLAARLVSGDVEFISILAGISGLIAGLAWVRWFTGQIADDTNYQPVILRRCQGSVPVHTRSLV